MRLFDPNLNKRFILSPVTSPNNGDILVFDSATNRWKASPSSGGGGPTTLTGDVTGSGSGTVPTTLSNTSVTPGTYTNASVTVDSKGRITNASSGVSGAPLSAQYITLANDASLTAERQLVIGTGLTGTDTGANGNYTIALSTPVSPSNLGTGSPSSLNFLSGDGTWKTVPTPSHSTLSNLSADDHPQYHTDARGDARYYTQAITDNKVATARFTAGPITQVMAGSASYTYDIALTQADWTHGWIHIRCNDTLPLSGGVVSGDFTGVGSTFEFTSTSTDTVGRVAAWQSQTSYPSTYAVCMMHPAIWYKASVTNSPLFMGFNSAVVNNATLANPTIGLSDVFLYPSGAGNVLRIVFRNASAASQTLRCTLAGRVFKNVSQTA